MKTLVNSLTEYLCDRYAISLYEKHNAKNTDIVNDIKIDLMQMTSKIDKSNTCTLQWSQSYCRLKQCSLKIFKHLKVTLFISNFTMLHAVSEVVLLLLDFIIVNIFHLSNVFFFTN